jgi:hypothetical protein
MRQGKPLGPQGLDIIDPLLHALPFFEDGFRLGAEDPSPDGDRERDQGESEDDGGLGGAIHDEG